MLILALARRQSHALGHVKGAQHVYHRQISAFRSDLNTCKEGDFLSLSGILIQSFGHAQANDRCPDLSVVWRGT